jgi:hypothetical protein
MTMCIRVSHLGRGSSKTERISCFTTATWVSHRERLGQLRALAHERAQVLESRIAQLHDEGPTDSVAEVPLILFEIHAAFECTPRAVHPREGRWRAPGRSSAAVPATAQGRRRSTATAQAAPARALPSSVKKCTASSDHACGARAHIRCAISYLSRGNYPQQRWQPVEGVLTFGCTSQQHGPCLQSMQPFPDFSSREVVVLPVSNAKSETHLLGVLGKQLRLQEAQCLLQVPRLHNQLKLREVTALVETAECQVTKCDRT